MSKKSPGVIIRTTFTVHFRLTLGIVLGLLSVAAFLAYAFVPSVADELKFAVALVGGAAAIYAGYYVAATLRSSVENAKKQRAFEILQDLNDPELVRLRDLIDRKINTEKVSPDELYRTICDTEDLRHAVRIHLGLIEDMAIAIGEDYVDERLLYLSLMCMVPRLYGQLHDYISRERGRYKSEVLYTEFQRLASAWAKHRSVRTGNKIVYVPPE